MRHSKHMTHRYENHLKNFFLIILFFMSLLVYYYFISQTDIVHSFHLEACRSVELPDRIKNKFIHSTGKLLGHTAKR